MRIELSTFQDFQTFWEASAQDNLTPEASGRPGTRLELREGVGVQPRNRTYTNRVATTSESQPKRNRTRAWSV